MTPRTGYLRGNRRTIVRVIWSAQWCRGHDTIISRKGLNVCGRDTPGHEVLRPDPSGPPQLATKQ